VEASEFPFEPSLLINDVIIWIQEAGVMVSGSLSALALNGRSTVARARSEQILNLGAPARYNHAAVQDDHGWHESPYEQ
jgi:hypothetical protein